MTHKDPACGTGNLLPRRTLLKGLPAAGVAMMLPQAVVSDQPWNENMLEEIMSSANDLCNSLTPHLGYHEYVVVKDAKVQRLLDALRAIPIDDYGDACTGREGYPET